MERFWPKVDKGPDCWLWTGARDIGNYGVINIDGAPVHASRVSWELHNEPIPDGLNILHSCDNPPCVNPAHLRTGTQADNMADKTARRRLPTGDNHWTRRDPDRWQVVIGKHRARCGEANPRSKLTADQVRVIRERWAAGGATQAALGAEYGVGATTIAAIVHGRIWRE